jgi:competence protein ComEA
MNKSFICATLLALLTGFSISSHAADTKPVKSPNVELAAIAQVNINTADAETLTRELKGIGAAKAKAIVEYREAHGPFSSVDELLEVKGIGTSILDKNRAILSLN